MKKQESGMMLRQIATVYTDFPEKFGIPRQSGLVEGLRGRIEFLPAYRAREAVRGMEGFSHLWLLWGFSEVKREGWSATVAPPRLGGRKRMGVFATRSPYRPNPIGLSAVRLERVELDPEKGPILHVRGVDMLDGTPIYDIKPYLPYADAHPDAKGGFGEEQRERHLRVEIPEELLARIPEEERQNVLALLSEDPRTAYIHDEEREWGIAYAGFNYLFYVRGEVLTVMDVLTIEEYQRRTEKKEEQR